MHLRSFVRTYWIHLTCTALLPALAWLVANRIVAVIVRALVTVLAIVVCITNYKDHAADERRKDRFAEEQQRDREAMRAVQERAATLYWQTNAAQLEREAWARDARAASEEWARAMRAAAAALPPPAPTTPPPPRRSARLQALARH
jgi:hypothetical protein